MKAKLAVFLLVVVLAVSAFSGTALAVTYYDVAGEFMCQCDCNLVLKDCETMVCGIKDNLKQVISGMIKNGQSKEEIIKIMRINYKDQILSAPPKSGFDLTAWITPFVVVLAGGAGISMVTRRWVGEQRDRYALEVAAGASKPSKAPSKKYSDKLTKELDEYGGF